MGPDYPFAWTKTAVDHILATPGLSDGERVAILEETAEKLLAIRARSGEGRLRRGFLPFLICSAWGADALRRSFCLR